VKLAHLILAEAYSFRKAEKYPDVLRRAPTIQCACHMRIHDRDQQMNEIASATMKLLLQKD